MPNVEVNVTLLHRAAGDGDHELVKLLLAVPNVDANVAHIFERTPLHGAARQGHDNVVSLQYYYR